MARSISAAFVWKLTHAKNTKIFSTKVWRQERDYFFEAEMNGVDWQKERDRYAALLPYAATRYDLVLLLGDMIGELSNSHTYVGGGDSPDLSAVNTGMLGVDFVLDSASGRYKFAKIYPGENRVPSSPFAAHRTRRQRKEWRLSARRKRPSAEISRKSV